MVVRSAVAPSHGRRAPIDWLRRALDLGSLLAFGLLPAVLLLGLLMVSAVERSFDFRVFWEAGRDVLDGLSPYPPVDPDVLQSEREFVYPAPAALAMAPLAALPYSVAAPLFVLVLILAAAGALRLCGVTDWRCYGLAALTAPLGKALDLGAVTPLLLLGVAVLWRYRNRAVVAGLTVAALVVLKVFLWPLLVWLLATRRVLSAGVAVAVSGSVAVLSWAALGFAGLSEYPRLLATLSDVLEGKGYSLTAAGLAAGLPGEAARGFSIVIGAAGLATIVVLGRRGGRDWPLLVGTVGLALALSPIVWSHYFLLLLVPVAVVQPRLGWLWGTLLLFWVIPGQSALPPVWENGSQAGHDLPPTPRVGELYLILIGLALAALVLVATSRARDVD